MGTRRTDRRGMNIPFSVRCSQPPCGPWIWAGRMRIARSSMFNVSARHRHLRYVWAPNDVVVPQRLRWPACHGSGAYLCAEGLCAPGPIPRVSCARFGAAVPLGRACAQHFVWAIWPERAPRGGASKNCTAMLRSMEQPLASSGFAAATSSSAPRSRSCFELCTSDKKQPRELFSSMSKCSVVCAVDMLLCSTSLSHVQPAAGLGVVWTMCKCRHGTRPAFAVVSMPGSRPPTESLRDVEASGLLSKVPARMKNATRIFSNGNRAWPAVAKKLKLKSFCVNHQNKEWTRKGAKTRRAGVSAVCGTQ